MGKKYLYKEIVTVENRYFEIFRISNDVNGNPRYVVHFRDLGIDLWDYDNINKLFGFTKYRAKWFGGGVVFQSYNIAETLKYALDKVKEKEGE
ncbi:hypothetical protein [Staphylococcus phage PT94]